MSQYINNLVSIIVPAFNAANSISRCLDSIFNQSFKTFEVIVIDDGSQDNTADIVSSYPQKIQLIKQKNQGETAARNTGFKRACGEFTTFIDHDDYWEPDFLARCTDFLCANRTVSAVSVGSRHISALGAKEFLMPPNIEQLRASGPNGFVIEDFFEFWATNNHLCAGSAMIRSTVIEESTGQRADLFLSGDLEFWALLGTTGKWGFIPKLLLHIDGTQAKGSGLFEKYHSRYLRCTTVEDWERRIIPRITKPLPGGYKKIRGRIATWYIFAFVFVRNDIEAYRTAGKYKQWLEGRYGVLWKIGHTLGKVGWKFMCILVRVRLRYQYTK